MERSRPACLNLIALMLILLTAALTAVISDAFGWFEGPCVAVADHRIFGMVLALVLVFPLGFALFSRWRNQNHGAARSVHERTRAHLASPENKPGPHHAGEPGLESETRFRAILEAVKDSIYIKDKHLTYTFANPAMERFLGLSSSKLVGLKDEDIFGSEAGAFIREEDLRVLGGEITEEEIAGPHGGKNKAFRVIKVPMRDPGGKIVGLFGIARDISECRLLEDQLIQAQKMEAVGTMASGLAHDFNNLLQAIQGFTDLLLLDKRESDPDFKELKEIHRAARRGSELTRKLLNYSRKDESKRRTIDLNYLVQQLWGLLERTVPKMVRIELDLAREIMLVNVDPLQIEQVLMNLAMNAKDAMPEGGRLTILTENVVLDENFSGNGVGAKPGHYVMLSVSDSGHGMDPETSARIFEPFFSTKAPDKGTGLGLATVYGIIKGHGGHIVCLSEPGQGTTFNVYLPADIEELKAAELKRGRPPVTNGEGTVLLVDDEEPLLNLGRRVLASFGYSVITATSGESALDLYKKERARIDLVVLDLIMPGMGGKNFLRELLNINPDIKVLVTSGCMARESAEDCMEYGARGFINKPYDMGQIIAKVREVLDENPV